MKSMTWVEEIGLVYSLLTIGIICGMCFMIVRNALNGDLIQFIYRYIFIDFWNGSDVDIV